MSSRRCRGQRDGHGDAGETSACRECVGDLVVAEGNTLLEQHLVEANVVVQLATLSTSGDTSDQRGSNVTRSATQDVTFRGVVRDAGTDSDRGARATGPSHRCFPIRVPGK